MMIQKRIGSGYFDIEFEAEQVIRRFRGRKRSSLSPNDKDALIAALSTLVVAAGRGFRPSAIATSMATELSFALELDGQMVG